MKPDITSREDLILIVNAFYSDVRENALLGPIFNGFLQNKWDQHLPKMYDFWETMLFNTGSYRGRPFLPHLDVNARHTLSAEHFGTWLKLFHQTVDRYFEGPRAEELKFKSFNIKEVWHSKLDYINNYKEE